ncbi:hypothetical protein HI914_00931 [Erysiphe necator]|nr:hypothetical protein HI914_00931 [Erysiphe necator]
MAAVFNTGFYPHGFQIAFSSQILSPLPLPVPISSSVSVTADLALRGLALVPQPPAIMIPPILPTAPANPSNLPNTSNPANSPSTSNTAGNSRTIRIYSNKSLVINNIF